MDLQTAYTLIAEQAADLRVRAAGLNLSLPPNAGPHTKTLAATLAYHLEAASREAKQLAATAPGPPTAADPEAAGRIAYEKVTSEVK